MNERIRELAGKALDEAVPETWTTLTAYDLNKFTEKFAELLIRECATAITDDDLAKDCGTFMMDSWAKGMRYSAHVLYEHFGVKP